MGLEGDYPPAQVESLPSADAVVILGGGMGANTNALCYPELYMSADRVAHAARIWKAGKAPIVISSGQGDLWATVPFLKELGVPESAILAENDSRNTEENAKFVERVLRKRVESGKLKVESSAYNVQPPTGDSGDSTFNIQRSTSKPKVLLVTSAWHMRRALLMFRKYVPNVDVIPAACDYEATIGSGRFNFWDALVPNSDSLLRNSYMLKEYVGYWGYRLLR